MRALVVGAGAVGTTFGAALQRGGARVTWYTRPAYADGLRDGVVVGDRNRDIETRVTPHEVCDDVDALSGREFDVAVICVSSTALRRDWFDAFAKAASGVRCWVVLQPGLDDRAWVAERVGGVAVVGGLITLIAWVGALPGDEGRQAEVSVWRPPLSRIPLEGPREHVERVATCLTRGGLPARSAHGLASRGALPTAVMMPAIVGLELAGWSLRRFAGSDVAARAAAAAREATAIVCARQGLRRPWYAGLVRAPVLRVAARVAPRLVPFDLERYLEVHFTKVGDQTRDFVSSWVDEAERLGVDAPALATLRGRLLELVLDPQAL